MATTTNYGWTTPDNTAYVKDGASAIRTLGSSVDTTLFAATSGKTVGYQLIGSASFTAASEVIISGITTDYQNYHLVVQGSGSTSSTFLYLNLRNSGGNVTAANYFACGINNATNAGTPVGQIQTSATNTSIGKSGTSGFICTLDIDAGSTTPNWVSRSSALADGAALFQDSFAGGYSATISPAINALRITPGAGTLTGNYRLYGGKG